MPHIPQIIVYIYTISVPVSVPDVITPAPHNSGNKMQKLLPSGLTLSAYFYRHTR